LRKEGKIRRIGLSNVSAHHVAVSRAITPIHSVQNRLGPSNLVEQGDVLATCERHGIAFLAYSPLGGRWDAKAVGQRGALGTLAAERGVSPQRILLAWLLTMSPVIIPLVGARTVDTMRDSAAAGDFELTAEDRALVSASLAG